MFFLSMGARDLGGHNIRMAPSTANTASLVVYRQIWREALGFRREAH
ncbi:MAG: hypothetical protein ACJ746_07610 [Bryobacteraceae bacterium]